MKSEPSVLSGIRVETHDELVYQALRRSIIVGELQAGDALDQTALASKLGTSRMPLRMALKRLAADGLIEAVPYRTPTVAPLTQEDYRELMVAREALEPLVARHAVQHMTADEIAQMEGYVDEQSQALTQGDVEQYLKLDRQFHATLYAPANLQRITGYIENLRDASDRYTYIWLTEAGGTISSHDDHREILKACQARDSEYLFDLVASHVKRDVEVMSQRWARD